MLPSSVNAWTICCTGRSEKFKVVKVSSNQKESVQDPFPLRFGSVVTSGVGGCKKPLWKVRLNPALYINKRGTKKTIQLYTKPYILFWTRISRTGFRTRMVRMEFRTRMERIVRNVCNERNVRNERYIRNERKKRKTRNGNRRWRDSSLLQTTKKIQQFWAFFRRFDINIFNLREHLSPRNFAYSVLSFT